MIPGVLYYDDVPVVQLETQMVVDVGVRKQYNKNSDVSAWF